MIRSMTPESKLLITLIKNKIEFTDGINLVTGPNGSGKTSLLRALAENIGIDTGMYVPKSCPAPASAFKKHYVYPDVFKKGSYDADIEWDGAYTYLFEPQKYAGFPATLEGRGDLESFQSLTGSIMSKRSTGQNNLNLLEQLFKKIVGSEVPDFLPPLQKALEKESARTANRTEPFIEWVLKLRANGVGKPTLLLDEPDEHLSFPNQTLLYKNVLPKIARTWQVIVVSHSPFSLLLNNPNVIELSKEPNYYADMKQHITNLAMNL